MKAGTRVIAIRKSDGEQIKFARVKDAAKFAGITPSSMSHRISCGTVDGKGYYYIMDEGGELTKWQMYRARKKSYDKRNYLNEDVELDKEKYRTIPYEVRNLRESITPCPFKEYPKPMVGSVQCVRCTSFRGRNKQSHEVACCRIII